MRTKALIPFLVSGLTATWTRPICKELNFLARKLLIFLLETIFEENTESDLLSFVFAKKVFDDDLPEIKRFVGKANPMSFTKKLVFKIAILGLGVITF